MGIKNIFKGGTSSEWAEEIGIKRLYIVGIIVGVVLLGAMLFIVFGRGPSPVPPPGTDTSQYGFETGTMGWKRQSWTDSQAVTAVTQTTSQAKLGSGSIQCTVELVGGDDNKGRGEAYVEDMRKPAARPTSATVPVDLSNSIVTVWLYIPSEAMGDPSLPNGIQLLFKSETNSVGDDWPSAYSTWYNIGSDIITDEWFQISVDIPYETWAWPAPENIAHLPDFTKIIQMGVKIGAGVRDYGLPTQTWSTATFTGTIFIDGVNWETRSP